MKPACSGVILTGGENKRFSGLNKAFTKVGGIKLIERVYSVFKELFDEIILVTNEPLEYLEWDVMVTRDLFPFRSSMTGIHAGLHCAANPYVFIAACDTPFLKKGLVGSILDSIEPKFDIVIPKTKAGLEPLCAAYSKKCLTPVEKNLVSGKLKIRDFFEKVKVKKISEELLREQDPDLVSFFNINTLHDLDKACEMDRQMS